MILTCWFEEVFFSCGMGVVYNVWTVGQIGLKYMRTSCYVRVLFIFSQEAGNFSSI